MLRLLLLGLIMLTPLRAQAETAYFSGGCFWCMEAEFQETPGVTKVISGYIHNPATSPEPVETVEIHYDAKHITYEKLLGIFWGNIDPFDAGGQFYDRGPKYATVIYYQNPTEEELAKQSKAAMERKLAYPFVTRIEPVFPFTPASAEHQDFYQTNPFRYQSYKYGSGREKTLKRIWQRGE